MWIANPPGSFWQPDPVALARPLRSTSFPVKMGLSPSELSMKFSTLLIESIRQSEIPLRFEPGAEEAVATPVTGMLKAWVAAHLPEAASSEFDFGQKVLVVRLLEELSDEVDLAVEE